jgi:hypothetical protein
MEENAALVVDVTALLALKQRPAHHQPAGIRRPPAMGRKGTDRWRRCAPVRAGPCTHADLRAGPATAAPCWPSSRPTPPWPPRPTGSGRPWRWGSDNRDHLADLPQLLRQLRAARRPRPQARLLLPGLPAGRLPRPSTHQRRPAHRPPGLALPAPRAAPPARRVPPGRRRPAPPPAPGTAHRPPRPAPTAARKRQRPAARRRKRRRPGAHPAHHRRPVAQGRRHQLPPRGGRLPGESRGPARQVRPVAQPNRSSRPRLAAGRTGACWSDRHTGQPAPGGTDRHVGRGVIYGSSRSPAA